MIQSLTDEFWWSGITGPRSVVTQVADALGEKSVAVLKVPDDLPWRHQMRACVESAFQSGLSSGVTIQTIDADDECPTGEDPARYILERFARGAVAQGYRARSGGSLPDYLSRNGVLGDTLLWVKGLDEAGAAEWLRFCRAYTAHAVPKDGRFLLEVPPAVAAADSKKIQTVDFSACVSGYDLQLFNSLLLEERPSLSPQWRQYIAAVAAKLCGVDAQVSERLIACTDFTAEEPLDGLQRLAEDPELERRGRGADSTHVLSLFRRGETAQLERRVWAAQVQVLFPLIELERADLIAAWRQALLDAMARREFSQFGQPITAPEDFELGTLVHFLFSEPAIFIPDQAAQRRISFLHKCRNAIAHGNCCTHEQVGQLFS